MEDTNMTANVFDPAEASSAAGPQKSAKVNKSKLIGVHCTQRMVTALDRFIAEEHDEISRPEAIRQILRRWLTQSGYYQ